VKGSIEFVDVLKAIWRGRGKGKYEVWGVIVLSFQLLGNAREEGIQS
jgi:hypothetical protein